jgi:hypothetical protein
MLATIGTGFATVKAQQNKNPHQCCGRQGRGIALRCSFWLLALEFAVHKITWVAVAEHSAEVVKWREQWYLLLEQGRFLKCSSFANSKHFEC